jgi:hypothetical protein
VEVETEVAIEATEAEIETAVEIETEAAEIVADIEEAAEMAEVVEAAAEAVEVTELSVDHVVNHQNYTYIKNAPRILGAFFMQLLYDSGYLFKITLCRRSHPFLSKDFETVIESFDLRSSQTKYFGSINRIESL